MIEEINNKIDEVNISIDELLKAEENNCIVKSSVILASKIIVLHLLVNQLKTFLYGFKPETELKLLNP